MGKFREGQRVLVTAGRHAGECATVILNHRGSYAVRLDGSGDLIYETNLKHADGFQEEAEDYRTLRAAEEARAKEQRAKERLLEEQAEAKALCAFRAALARLDASEAAAICEALGLPPLLQEPVAPAPAVEELARVAARPAASAAPREEQEELEERRDAQPQMVPVQAGVLRKSMHIMIKGRPCKCLEIANSKTGKHGHAKVHILGADVFTGRKYEEILPASQFTDVPSVKRVEYLLLNVDPDTGAVSLLHESGMIKEDLNLPTFATKAEQTDDDRRLYKEIVENFDTGKAITVTVVAACGAEKIVDVQVS